MKQGDKKKIIERLVDVPPKGLRPFWAREYTLLNRLLKQQPDLKFWSKVSFGEKFPSLAYLLTDIGKGQIRRKYNEFSFEIPVAKTYNLGEKAGEDRAVPLKKKTIRSFLQE